MLTLLTIENFALIERLEVEFQEGLNLITGETGSGKSILVEAVALLVGGRASQKMVRHGFERARVEGIFVLSPVHPARLHLKNGGITLQGDELIIRREISLSGTNKIFVNGALVTQGFLSELGSLLSDLHGQHDQQLLLHRRTHLDFLDAFGQNQAMIEEVSQFFRQLKKVRAELERFQRNEQERLKALDRLSFQITDIEKLQLKPGLDVELEAERRLLSNTERRYQAAQESYQLLYEREHSVLSLLNHLRGIIGKLAQLDPTFDTVVSKMLDLHYQIEDISYQFRDYVDSIEFNPTRLETIEQRLAEIQKARHKYGESVDKVLDYYEKVRQEVKTLSEQEQQIEALSERESQLTEEYLKLARRLSEKRGRDADRLCRQVERELSQLAMENTVFTVALETPENNVTEKGIDRAEFLISPNPGETPKPLTKIISGGELSRVILALKSILTMEDYPKTLIFDEVDAGIGGRAASSVGEKLARLAEQHQVFCITHLPHIAPYAAQHFHMNKSRHGSRTTIEITPLKLTARVKELARMMAGRAVSETTLKQARELLENQHSRK